MLLLLSSLSKHRQEGKRLTVCLVPYATWQQSLTDIAGVWATAKGSFFYLFYSPLPCMCLSLGRKCETKSLSGPHQAGFTVWAQPEQGAALIVICAIFQAVLTIGSVEATDSCNSLSPARVRTLFPKGRKKYVWQKLLLFALRHVCLQQSLSIMDSPVGSFHTQCRSGI